MRRQGWADGYDSRVVGDQSTSRARTTGGTISIVLGFLSIVALPGSWVLLAFTSFVFAGKYAFVGVTCGGAILLATVGLAQGVICLRSAARLPEYTSFRRDAMSRGTGGAIFCSLLIVAYVLLWVWLPTQIATTPFGG